MPSKGIQVYTYIAVSNCEVIYEVPGRILSHNNTGAFDNDHLEVDKGNLPGIFSTTGRFSFNVKLNGNQVVNEWADINVLTGNPEGGTFKALVDQQAIQVNDIIVCYGFYDAGSGAAGLPNSHQVYVTVTPRYSDWMHSIAPAGSTQAAEKLTKFVLPAAHDIGMNSMMNPNLLLQNAGPAFISTLEGLDQDFAAVAHAIAGPLVQHFAPNIIQSLAITQKDTVQTILDVGARYFEFRPAHLPATVRTALPDALYFMHGPIPGMMYKEFLHNVVEWLKAHPGEIVICQLRWDGVPPDCARPTDQEKQDAVNEALKDSGLNIGNFDDVRNVNVQDLRSQGKRLIIVENLNVYSTYDDKAYATLNGDTILQQFQALSSDGQRSHDMSNIQCQATATNITDVVIQSVLDSNTSNSCLLATKAICDNKLLPWVRDNALSKLTEPEGLIVVMNDFFEGGTADVAISMAKTRLGESTSYCI